MAGLLLSTHTKRRRDLILLRAVSALPGNSHYAAFFPLLSHPGGSFLYPKLAHLTKCTPAKHRPTASTTPALRADKLSITHFFPLTHLAVYLSAGFATLLFIWWDPQPSSLSHLSPPLTSPADPPFPPALGQRRALPLTCRRHFLLLDVHTVAVHISPNCPHLPKLSFFKKKNIIKIIYAFTNLCSFHTFSSACFQAMTG